MRASGDLTLDPGEQLNQVAQDIEDVANLDSSGEDDGWERREGVRAGWPWRVGGGVS
jgi:hypothetical protein